MGLQFPVDASWATATAVRTAVGQTVFKTLAIWWLGRRQDWMGSPWCLLLLSPLWSFPCAQPLRLLRAVPVRVQGWRIPMCRSPLGASHLWAWSCLCTTRFRLQISVERFQQSSWTGFKVFLPDLTLGSCRLGARTIFVWQFKPCKDGEGQLHMPQQHECTLAQNGHFVVR